MWGLGGRNRIAEHDLGSHEKVSMNLHYDSPLENQQLGLSLRTRIQ
jgi:hypothetical protein